MAARPARPARFLRTQQLFAATVPALVVALSITGFVWAQKGVTVVVDGNARRFTTQAIDVAEALRDAHVEVGARDLLMPTANTRVEDGDTIVVRRAVPVTLKTSGDSIELAVVGKTVADALVAAGIDPTDSPAVVPSVDTPLEPGMEIEVLRTVVRVLEAKVALPFGTTTKIDTSLPRGQRETVVEGKPGTALRTYRALVTDGVEGQRVLVSERVVAKPVNRIVAQGSAAQVAKRVRAKPALLRVRATTAEGAKGRQLAVVATAYAPGSDGVDWRTATGTRAGLGAIAVDPKVIPLGTRVFVPGYGYGVACDTGGAIRGSRIDLCFDTRAEALLWGRRSVSIVVVD